MNDTPDPRRLPPAPKGRWPLLCPRCRGALESGTRTHPCRCEAVSAERAAADALDTIVPGLAARTVDVPGCTCAPDVTAATLCAACVSHFDLDRGAGAAS